MTQLKFTIGVVLMLLASMPGYAAVQLETGALDGVSDGEVTTFRGIPYASPPVGENRWRPPLPAARWTGVRQADHDAPTCLQRGRYPEDAPLEPMSEDCLYLNVWAPAVAARTSRLPVMVWIHGGGLESGSGSVPLYAGDALAKRGVIVVSLNYRLGALGFLAHPGLSAESAGKSSGNYGLLDQIAALQWVRRNIRAFGGDPENVTVFGQSSGSISISVLCASPLAAGLFRRAIGQSGGLFEPVDIAPEFSLSGAEEAGGRFAAGVGAKSVSELRAIPAERITATPFVPNPVIDGLVLREAPFDAYTAGRVNKADVLIGFMAGEGYEFLQGRTVTAETLPALLRQDFPPFIVSLVGPAAPSSDQEARDAFVSFEGNMRFGWDMLTWARLHARSRSGKTFLYRFDVTPTGEPGARHGVEMPYVFGHEPGRRPWTEQDRNLSERMMTYWTNFSRTGDPNGPGQEAWPAFETAHEMALVIGDRMKASALPNMAELTAIDRLYVSVRFVLRYWPALAGVALIAGVLFIWIAWRAARQMFRVR